MIRGKRRCASARASAQAFTRGAVAPARARAASAKARAAKFLLTPLVVATLTLSGCSQPSAGTSNPDTAPSAGVSAFTPAATPTVMAAGAFAKPSTGGMKLMPTASGSLDGKVVVVDPGHNGGWETSINMKYVQMYGGRRPCALAGGTAPDKKTTEHSLVWDMANRTATILRDKGATVVLTRPSDDGIGPCNNERAEIANREHADYFVSIHVDGNESQKARGFHVIYSGLMVGGDALTQRSLAAAKIVVTELQAKTQLPIAAYIGKGDGVFRRTDLGALNDLKSTPGALVELANIIQTEDWALLQQDATRQGVAEALAASAEQTILDPGADSSTSPSTGQSKSPSASPSR